MKGKRRIKKASPLILLATALLLSACGQKPVFGVSTEEDNCISVTADRGPKDSVGLGYLTVGENEQIVIDASGIEKGGKLSMRFMAGVLGSENFSDEPANETTVSGGDNASFTMEPGEYTVGVTALSKVTGTARIYTEAVSPAEADIALQPGEYFEGTVVLEGMPETIHYEAVRNETIGFEMGYDYERFARQSGVDRERFVSIWDDSDNPEIYLEITRSADGAEAAAASIIEALSGEYNVTRGEYTLDRAGSYIGLNADTDKEGLMSIWQLHTIFIIPVDDECLVAWGHYTQESADGFGAMFRGMMNTFKAL